MTYLRMACSGKRHEKACRVIHTLFDAIFRSTGLLQGKHLLFIQLLFSSCCFSASACKWSYLSAWGPWSPQRVTPTATHCYGLLRDSPDVISQRWPGIIPVTNRCQFNFFLSGREQLSLEWCLQKKIWVHFPPNLLSPLVTHLRLCTRLAPMIILATRKLCLHRLCKI